MRDAVTCVLVVVVVALSGYAAYAQRTPYWRAAKAVAAGNAATAELQAIATRHSAVLQPDPLSQQALEGWKNAAEDGLRLRGCFTAALDGARYLSEVGGGTVKDQADFDIQYYGLCLEWMDLYDRIQKTFQRESMEYPPPYWHEIQDDIVLRIRSLAPPSARGS